MNPYMIGEKVYLRMPTEEDAMGAWHEWLSDEETTKFMVDRFWPNSVEGQKDFLRGAQQDRNRLLLSVVTRSEDKHVGVVSLSAINWVHRFADVAMLIGDKKYRKGGYAVEALNLLLKAAFDRLNLSVVKGAYVAVNDKSAMLVNVFGFSENGVWPSLVKIDGEDRDVVMVSLSRDRWREIRRR